MTETKIVRAWNSKWHIFEEDNGVAPAEPVDAYNRVAKPERQRAITGCGLGIFVRAEKLVNYRADFIIPNGRGGGRPIGTFCKNCMTVLNRRYPKPPEPKTWG